MSIIRLGARASVSVLALCAISPAFAQSTGSRDFDEAIVVTGTRGNQGVGGIVNPITPKTKATLNAEFIQHETPGQSLIDTINNLPGVSFQNNDPYGSAGGTLSIRGFDASRIALTWDGLPLNDTGNYAIYSNQQMDPELAEQITVSLGSTDVDSPSASASGSTVNYVTRNPTEDFHARLSGSVGDYNYFRIFGVVDTGIFTPFGTRAFLSASKADNHNVFNDLGKISKQQYNAKIYQPIGSNGDFVSIAGHWNKNLNNFFGSVPLRVDTAGRTVGTGSSTGRFPLTKDERFYHVTRCQVPGGVSGVADAASTCGSDFDYRYNPSNTGNIRFNSRFTLTDKLILTVDAGYEYTLANGGGTVTANEGYSPLGLTGFYNNAAYLGGVDLNGDGDSLDKVTVAAPSTTNTNRYVANISLRYDFSEGQTVRAGYSLDYGRHRQTGEVSLLKTNGFAVYPFPSDNPILDSTGRALQKRDRFSKAILNQAFGEYRGLFLNDRLTITAGVRAPFFERNLNNYCFTTSASGFVDCSGQNPAADAAYAAANPTVQGPQQRIIHYNKVLPSGGAIFNLTSALSVYGNYSKGIQVPGTDNLYNAFYFAPGTADAKGAKPETTDNFDAGFRYKSGKLQAQISGWYTIFHDRLASSYDPVNNITVYRNLGTVDKYGVDADVSYKPVSEVTLYAFGSYLKSKIKDNVQTGTCSQDNATNGVSAGVGICTAAGQPIYALTAGKRESAAPTYTFGGRIEGSKGPVTIGLEAKRTGPRYINDQNLPVFQTIGGVLTQVYGAKAAAYNIVNLDARLSMAWAGMNDRTYLQLNVTNLFDKLYVGGFGGTTANNSVTFAQIGAPRAVSGTFNIGF